MQTSHFTSVLDVRRARSDERVVSRLGQPNPPCVKKERNFKEVLIHNHSQQIFSAQPFSADLLSRFSQQIFSADLLSRSSQQIFSADLLSRSSQHSHSQQIFSADLLSTAISQQIFCCGQGLVVSYCLIICCGQGLVVSYCLIICCGQGLVVSYCLIICCGQGLVVSYCLQLLSDQLLSFAVVRGWWSAIVLSCWWSILHEFFRRTLSRSFREKGFSSKRPHQPHKDSINAIKVVYFSHQ